ncbi:MAG: helix-hairpin-helix domain-containing protein [Weeksellaceae bacterium]
MSYLEITKLTLKKHPVEIILLSISLILTVVCGIAYLQTVKAEEPLLISDTAQTISPSTNEPSQDQVIFVEISGAVVEPSVYKLAADARLYNLIQEAGGLTPSADADFVARNFNLAKRMADQEKIYIPFQTDITQGIFVEQPQRLLEYLAPFYTDSTKVPASKDTRVSTGSGININDASSAELDKLPGVGPSTAQKIIDNRPYTSVDELLSKNVLKDSVFEQIQSLISL